MKKTFSNNSKYRILIIGVNGMIGHKLFNYFSGQSTFETIGLLRRFKNNFDKDKKIIQEENWESELKPQYLSRLEEEIEMLKISRKGIYYLKDQKRKANR